MNIKNINFNINYICSPYKSNNFDNKYNKTDTDSINVDKPIFSNELSKITKFDKIKKVKTDKIEFSKKNIDKNQSISDTCDKIISDINKDKDKEFIEKLKKQVSTNSYPVNSVELAETLLYNIQR